MDTKTYSFSEEGFTLKIEINPFAWDDFLYMSEVVAYIADSKTKLIDRDMIRAVTMMPNVLVILKSEKGDEIKTPIADDLLNRLQEKNVKCAGFILDSIFEYYMGINNAEKKTQTP